MIRLLVAGAVLAGLVIVAAPSALALPTSLQISVEVPDDPIRPLSGSKAFPATVKYSYPAAAAKGAIAPTRISLSSDGPSWATVTISPATLFLMPGDTSETTGDFSVIVSTLADAPALEPRNVKIKATAQKNGDLLEASNAESAFPVRADYFGLLNVEVPPAIRMIGPQKTVDFPLLLTNLGNALTKVEFLVNATAGLQVPTPQDAQLGSPIGDAAAARKTVMLTVQAPHRTGYMNDDGSVTVTMRSAYALDPSKRGDEMTVSLLVTTVGFAAPGPGAPEALAGLAGLALAARYRRRRESARTASASASTSSREL